MLMGPEQLTDLLRQPDWSAPVLATALAVSFALGAVHALEPGHGKTLVAAYLVGARGTLRHAMILGGTVTFTHTISVFLMGFATMFLTQYVMPQTIIPVLGVISGLMIIGVGVWLLIKQVRHTHDHHHHQHDVSLGSLITLGASGGLVPCPTALVLLLTSISLGHAAKGLLLLVSFSAGLAIVLTAVGATVIYGKHLLPKRSHDHHHHDHHDHDHGHDHHHHHHVHWLPVASAIVIIAAGIVITGTTLQSR
jgi:nickel/cobalt transporter (NicO) family protein